MEGLTEDELELLDPHPDIHALFVHFNTLYFEDKLGACSVEWSSGRMTACGGVCEWRPGGGCRIKLSEPLLKLRPARDLKMVLLHEMVHAFMMLGGIRDDDPGGHGTIFKSIIARINASAQPDHQRPPGGYNITVTHNYMAEVEHYRQHWWRCERCERVVKRAMNRPPQEADCRLHVRGRDCGDAACSYHMHVKHCGGAFQKIKEPEGYKDKKRKKADAGSSSGAAATSTGGSGAAQRPDGAPLPAKRPKKGGGRLAGAGDRPITDFFPTHSSGGPRPALPGAAAAGAAGSSSGGGRQGGGSVLPALQAVADQAAAAMQQRQPQQQQQQQQVPAEPTAEERRRLLAEAALRRLGGARGANSDSLLPQQQQPQPVHQQQTQTQKPPPPPQQQQQEQQPHSSNRLAVAAPLPRQGALPGSSPGGVIDLVESSDDEESGLAERLQHRLVAAARAPPAAAAAATPAAPAASAGLGGGPSSAAPPPGPSNGSAAAAVEGVCEGAASAACPICGHRWPAGELSNAALNAHIDECLTLAAIAAT